ncbi:MAG: hypothetical protein R3B96_23945 [Pirellulaceae bacterium]
MESHRINESSRFQAPDEAGLAFTPESGSFSVQVRDIDTGQVSRDGDSDFAPGSLMTTLGPRTLRASTDRRPHTINANRQLVISTDRPELSSRSRTIRREFQRRWAWLGSSRVPARPTLVSRTTSSVILRCSRLPKEASASIRFRPRLAVLGDQPIESLGGLSITQIYEQISVEVTQIRGRQGGSRWLEVFHNMIEAETVDHRGAWTRRRSS